MRPATAPLALLAAGLIGGLAALALSGQASRPAQATPAAPLPPAAVDALAAPPGLPAAVDGQPLPSLAPMLERVTPAVVNIHSRQVERVRNPIAEDPMLRRLFGVPGQRERVRQSLGSGVVIDAERGLVLTNNHVVEGATEVSVTLGDGRTLEAEFVGHDPDTDLALIRIPAEDLVAVALGDSARLRVGDFVVAVGNPFGLGQTVTSGIVSALGRTGLQGLGFQDFIQTDASINPGNSGGALVNLRGELVGINTAIFNPEGSEAGNIGIGFATPANLVREVVRQLLAYGEVRRGSLGVEAQALTPELARALGVASRRGALVARVREGSPAAAAGLQVGDLVVEANGQAILDPAALRNLEGLLPVGEPVPVVVVREGQRRTFLPVLQALPRELDGGELDARLAGAAFAELPERWKQQGLIGVVVSKLDPAGRAAASGLRQGDLVYGVDRARVADLQALQAALEAAGAAEALPLAVVRGRREGVLVMR